MHLGSARHVAVPLAAALLAAVTATAWTPASRHDHVAASATRPSAAVPSGRYTDLVFASAVRSTAVYATAPALIGGAPTTLRLDVYDPATVPGLQMNTVWDGIFHTTTWLCTLAGLGSGGAAAWWWRRRRAATTTTTDDGGEP